MNNTIFVPVSVEDRLPEEGKAVIFLKKYSNEPLNGVLRFDGDLTIFSHRMQVMSKDAFTHWLEERTIPNQMTVIAQSINHSSIMDRQTSFDAGARYIINIIKGKK